MKSGLVPCLLMVVEGLQVQRYFTFCTIVLMSYLDVREAKRNEFSCFLERTKNPVGEIDIKLCLFHFNCCYFKKRPFLLVFNMLIKVSQNSLCVSSNIWANSVECIVS